MCPTTSGASQLKDKLSMSAGPLRASRNIADPRKPRALPEPAHSTRIAGMDPQLSGLLKQIYPWSCSQEVSSVKAIMLTEGPSNRTPIILGSVMLPAHPPRAEHYNAPTAMRTVIDNGQYLCTTISTTMRRDPSDYEGIATCKSCRYGDLKYSRSH